MNGPMIANAKPSPRSERSPRIPATAITTMAYAPERAPSGSARLKSCHTQIAGSVSVAG